MYTNLSGHQLSRNNRVIDTVKIKEKKPSITLKKVIHHKEGKQEKTGKENYNTTRKQ